jgi:mannan endo-1,4-beta-mannosidase
MSKHARCFLVIVAHVLAYTSTGCSSPGTRSDRETGVPDVANDTDATERAEGEGEGEGEEPLGVTRPAASLGRGFFVVGDTLYDKRGQPFRVVGLNHTHAWGDQQDNLAAIAEFPKTNANVVRAVFMPGLGADTPAERRAVVERYLDHRIVPMVEDHRTTCSDDPNILRAAVDEWLHPENVAWLTAYEDRLILNIANEWLQSFDDDLWVLGYTEAIARLRAAGLHHLLVIDAGGACGQNPRSVRNRGAEILAADPEQNVAFSVHMYGYWRTSGASDIGQWNNAGTQSPWSIEAELRAIREQGLAVIVGEMAWDGADSVLYETRPALTILKELDVGFLGWSWNWNADPALDIMANNTAYTFNGENDLSDGGRLFLLDPEVGIRATARASAAFDVDERD